MPWISRGLRNGIVTSRYPRKADDLGAEFRGSVTVNRRVVSNGDAQRVIELCPSQAIALRGDDLTLDRGACVLCGRCVQELPDVFQFSRSLETSSNVRHALVVPTQDENDESLRAVRDELASRVKVLRRSIHVRHLDAGSDGSDEWEVAALTNPIYDVQRLGIYFTASPRHADVLLVTGVGTLGMSGPLLHTLEAMPDPKVVIAAGVDAIGGGLLGHSYASHAGISSLVPVDVFVPGSPATPFGLLHGILMAVNLLAKMPSSLSDREFTEDGDERGRES